MKYHLIGGRINNSSLDDLIEFYNGLEEGEKVTVFLNSMGGYYSAGEMILKILNDHHSITTLIAGEHIASSAFSIFFNFIGTKVVSPNTIGMIHEGSIEFEYRDRTSNYVQVAKENLETLNKIFLKKFTFLSTKEIVRYNKGEEIWLSNERLKDIFNV